MSGFERLLFSKQYELGESLCHQVAPEVRTCLFWIGCLQMNIFWLLSFLGGKKNGNKVKKQTFIEPKEMWIVVFTFLFCLVNVKILNKIKVTLKMPLQVRSSSLTKPTVMINKETDTAVKRTLNYYLTLSCVFP